MSKRGGEFQFVNPINSEDHYNEITRKDGFHLIEVWCSEFGSTTCTQNVFKSIYFEYDGSNPQLFFYKAEADKIISLNSYVGKAKPTFICYKNGVEVCRIQGLHMPNIRETVAKHCIKQDA